MELESVFTAARAERAVAGERRALLFGSEAARCEEVLPILYRSSLYVARAREAAEAARMAYEQVHDLIVVVLPARGAARFLETVRGFGSASKHAATLVIGEQGVGAVDPSLARRCNRAVSPSVSDDELHGTVATLLDVAPRIDLDPAVGVRLSLQAELADVPTVENLSASGMLLRTSDSLSIGTVFGFALELPGGGEPIRGRAMVVRRAKPEASTRPGVGVQFVALGGTGAERLGELVSRRRANSNGEEPSLEAAISGVSLPSLSPSSEPERLDRDAVARYREELAHLTPLLASLLKKGLRRRLAVADWYVTGAELGLESLRAFSLILQAVYEERSIAPEAWSRISDLVEVRRELAEFGRPEQDLSSRVRILLALRPALERLLRELAESESLATTELVAHDPGVVARVVVDVKRLVVTRRSLERLHEQLLDLRKPHLFFARGAGQRSADKILDDFGAVAASVGLSLARERLTHQRSLRGLADAVEIEIRSLAKRLEMIHERAFSRSARRHELEELEADLLSAKLQTALAATLSAGFEYLVRAYSAYRHAIESTGSDSALLDRAERLGALLAPYSGATTAQPVASR